MDRINELEELLDNLAEEVEPHFELIPEFMQKIRTTKKPLSIFSTTSFFPKIESIRHGIFEIAKIEEHYSINILYRSLIEHFVKHQYLTLKTIGSNDDSIGIDYWLFGQDKEILNFAKAAENSYRILGIQQPKPVDEMLREMGILDETKSKRLIQRKTDQFQYKNMINFIVETLGDEGIGYFGISPKKYYFNELQTKTSFRKQVKRIQQLEDQSNFVGMLPTNKPPKFYPVCLAQQ
jgi:hypothetical protein